MKTPDKIKKGLELHNTAGRCKECPYTSDSEFKKTCFQLVAADALAYIQQLETSYGQVSRALCAKDSATLEELLHAASQVKTRWVSVKEGLPEPFVSVLCYMPGEKPNPTVREGFITEEGVWFSWLCRRDSDEVTMWRPLPLPPKEDER